MSSTVVDLYSNRLKVGTLSRLVFLVRNEAIYSKAMPLILICVGSKLRIASHDLFVRYIVCATNVGSM
jgi:hypothetical protein